MDDRAGTSIEKWVVGKIETPIYIKKVICNPETTVPKVKEPEVYYMFLNFKYASFKFEENLSVEYPYPHTNKRKIDTPQTSSGIATTNAKELKSKMRTKNPFLFDIKWIFSKESAEKAGFRYWRL